MARRKRASMREGPLADLFIGLAIYSAQVPFSKWWLKTHRYGPMEWLWRTLTYGERPKMRRAIVEPLPAS